MTPPWWRAGAIYQVYPRSFQDGNGDGVGDLAGIRARLPYLAWLGVDAVWLSPIYRSPMADFGYDVADHCDVDPLFGTLEDWDALAAEARRLGLRLMLDYVPNHTSIEHPWFTASRAGGEQRVEVVERAEDRVDVAVVGDVVAEVRHRRGVERRQPDRLDAERRQVVEVAGDPRQVADAVAVGVGERAGVDLVDDPALPPAQAAAHGLWTGSSRTTSSP